LTGYRPFVRFSKGKTFRILDFGFWIEEREGHTGFSIQNPKSKIQNQRSHRCRCTASPTMVRNLPRTTEVVSL
jgi:hypothetical protein